MRLLYALIQTCARLYLLGHLVLAIGSVLFGIATVRAKVLPGKAATLFAVLGGFAVVPFF